MSEPVEWRKSSFSASTDACVQVSMREDVLVRDSKDPSGPVLRFNSREWTSFLLAVRNGEFDLPRSESPGAASA